MTGQSNKEAKLQPAPKGTVETRPLPILPLPILYVIGSLDVGGAEGHLARIVPRLDRRLWSPTIYAFVRRGELADSLESQGVPVYSSHIPGFLRGSGQATRVVRLLVLFSQLVWHMARHKPRLVHYFLPASYLLGLPATFIAHALTFLAGPLPRRVMSRRSLNLYQRKYPLLGRLEHLLHPGCSMVIGNSRAVIAELQAEGVQPDRLRLIYNGIECPQADRPNRPPLRDKLGFPDDSVVITKVANLIPYKGHSDLLKAFAAARTAAASEMMLCLVGRDDGIGPQLAAEARQLGIEDQVRFLGPRNDVADILAASDIGVLSSHEEGFSNAVLEGMAAGLPMVVTRVGGNPEAVVDKETGLLVEPRDPKGLAAALTGLAADPALRQHLGNAARGRVEACFSLQRCCQDYERLYAALLEPSQAR